MNKKTFYQIHKWLSLVFLIPLIVLSLTGLVITFRPRLAPVTAKMDNPIGLSAILLSHPHLNVGRINFNDQEATLFVDQKLITIERKTGTITKEADRTADPFYWAIQIHESFLLNKTGKIIVSISGIGLFFILLSGIFFWGRKTFFTQVKNLFKHGKPTKMKDLHIMAGVVAVLPLLFMGVTGFLIEFNSTFFKDLKPLSHQTPTSCTLEQQARVLGQIEMGNKGRINLCKSDSPYILVNDNKSSRQFTPEGQLISEIPNDNWSDSSFLRKSFFMHLHGGQNFGILEYPWGVLNGVSLFILSITGLVIWLRKQRRSHR